MMAGGGEPWRVLNELVLARLCIKVLCTALRLLRQYSCVPFNDAMSCAESRPAAEPLPFPGARLANLGIRLTLNRCTLSTP